MQSNTLITSSSHLLQNCLPDINSNKLTTRQCEVIFLHLIWFPQCLRDNHSLTKTCLLDSFSNVSIWLLSSLSTRRFMNLSTRRFTNLSSRSLKNLSTRRFTNLSTRRFTNPSARQVNHHNFSIRFTFRVLLKMGTKNGFNPSHSYPSQNFNSRSTEG